MRLRTCLFVAIALSLMWMTGAEGVCQFTVNGNDIELNVGESQHVSEACGECLCHPTEGLSCSNAIDTCDLAGAVQGND